MTGGKIDGVQPRTHNGRFTRLMDYDPSAPRIEQPYSALYPHLNVDDLLPIRFYNEESVKTDEENKIVDVQDSTDSEHRSLDPLLPKADRKDSSSLTQDHTDLPEYDQPFAQLGYLRRHSFSLPLTLTRNDNTVELRYPENLYPDSERAFPGWVDDMDLCEYDMDEQDLGILGYMNAKFQFQMSADVFEVVMHMFELESFKIELLMPPKHPAGGVGGVDDTQQCVVCNGVDSENGNAIIFCDGCNIAVHQDCYGVPFIPEGQWLCRRCMVSRGFKTSCVFCPQRYGAFKQTDTNRWAHILCGLWIPELSIRNAAFMEPISGIDLVPGDRYRLSCYICKQRGGACIQCVNKSCYQAFHPSCAQSAGLYMHMTGGIHGALADKSSMIVYCDRHTPLTADILVDVPAARKALELEMMQSQKSVSDSGHGKRFPYWRTSSETIVMPKICRDAVRRNILKRFGVDIEPVLLFMSRYWTLKRDAHGAMFSKRLRFVLDTNKYAFASRRERAAELALADKGLSQLLRVAKSVQATLEGSRSRPASSESHDMENAGDLVAKPPTQIATDYPECSDPSTQPGSADIKKSATSRPLLRGPVEPRRRKLRLNPQTRDAEVPNGLQSPPPEANGRSERKTRLTRSGSRTKGPKRKTPPTNVEVRRSRRLQ